MNPLTPEEELERAYRAWNEYLSYEKAIAIKLEIIERRKRQKHIDLLKKECGVQ